MECKRPNELVEQFLFLVRLQAQYVEARKNFGRRYDYKQHKAILIATVYIIYVCIILL